MLGDTSAMVMDSMTYYGFNLYAERKKNEEIEMPSLCIAASTAEEDESDISADIPKEINSGRRENPSRSQQAQKILFTVRASTTNH